MAEQKKTNKKWIAVAGIAGFAAGIVLTLAAVMLILPGRMLIVEQSSLGLDETVAALRKSSESRGWTVAGVRDMNKSLAKHGKELAPKVTIVELCHPEYAQRILTTDRYVASLMPCAIAVYEGDDGNVYVSKMNTGLMGKMFGGTIAAVMGGPVAADEHEMLKNIIK